MNYIDQNFYTLINEFHEKSEKEIFNHIKNLYLNLNPETKKGIEKFLNDFNYWGTLKESENNFEEIIKKAQCLKRDYREYQTLYENLEDYRSKLILFSVLNNWYNYDFKTLAKAKENNYDDYFDLDLIKTNKRDVLVDLGAFIGDTAISFTQNYGNNYKQIYCFEISPETTEYLKVNTKHIPNLKIIEKGVSDKKEDKYLNINEASTSANTLSNQGDTKVEITTIDEEIKEKITIIKSDIEGMEQQALKGAVNHIKKDHPKLLISIYHRNEDIWQIPKMIKEIDNTYKFYLRYHGGPIYPTEITLIAIWFTNIHLSVIMNLGDTNGISRLI